MIPTNIIFCDLGDILLPRRCVPYGAGNRTTAKAVDALRYCVYLQKFDEEPVLRLNYLLRKTYSQLVLISEWQSLFWKSDDLCGKLLQEGLSRLHDDFFTGYHPTLVHTEYDRHQVVADWLATHDVARHVIIHAEPWRIPVPDWRNGMPHYIPAINGLTDEVLKDVLEEFGFSKPDLADYYHNRFPSFDDDYGVPAVPDEHNDFGKKVVKT